MTYKDRHVPAGGLFDSMVDLPEATGGHLLLHIVITSDLIAHQELQHLLSFKVASFSLFRSDKWPFSQWQGGLFQSVKRREGLMGAEVA